MVVNAIQVMDILKKSREFGTQVCKERETYIYIYMHTTYTTVAAQKVKEI